jgi:transcriptional regulator with XRE-family HTH domain
MDFKVDEFRAYIRELIGSGTQAKFAADHGISPEHLSRLMRAENPGRPSKGTLRKLSYGHNDTYEELLRICGYKKAETEPGDALMSREKQVRIRTDEMSHGFSDMTRHQRTFKCIAEFLDEYRMLYDSKNVDFTVGVKVECDGKNHFNADYAVPVHAKYEFGVFSCTIYMVVYFSITTGGRVVVLDTAIDGRSISEVYRVKDENEKKKISELSCVYNIKRTYSAEERLLAAIFGGGENTLTEYVTTSVGFGINVSPSKIDRVIAGNFIRRHEDILDVDHDRIMESLNNGMDPFKAVNSFNEDHTSDSGFAAFVASVMREQTGIPFDYYGNPEDDEDLYVVILRSRDDEYSCDIEDIKEAAKQFAGELGLREYGEYIVKHADYCENKKMYYIDEEE